MDDRKRELLDAVAQDPSNQAAVDELQRLLSETGDWSGLVDLYIHLAQNSEDPQRVNGWLRQGAEIAETHMADARRAVELLSAGLETDADPLGTLTKMRALLEGLEDWEGLLEVTEGQADATEDTLAKAELVFGMGEILEARLQDLERALVCYQAAFRADTRCLRALYAARRIYRETGRWDMVAELLDVELQNTTDPSREAEIYQELGTLLLYDLEQPELARKCFEGYLALRPDDEAMRAQLLELGGAAGEPKIAEPEAETESEAPEEAPIDEPAEAPSEAPAETESEAPEEATTEEPAETESDEPEEAESDEPEEAESDEPAEAESDEPEEAASDEPEEAESDEPAETESEAPEEATSDEPAETEREAPEEAGELPAVEGDALPDELAERLAALEAEADELPVEARRDKLIEAAGLLAGQAPGASQLARIYLAATRVAPGDTTLWRQVGRTMQPTESVAQAIGAGLDSMIEADHDERGPALKGARILFGAQHLGEARAADRLIRDLARKEGEQPGVREWQIERLLENGKWRELQQVFVAMHGGDPAAARLHALREMALLAEGRAADHGKAADFWRQVHMADKDDREARQALVRLYRELEKWAAYADVFKAEIQEIPAADVDAKLLALRALAEVYTEHLKQDAVLLGIYGEILELDPSDAETLSALISKYEAMRRWPDLVKVLQAQVENADDLDTRIQLNLRLAELFQTRLRNQQEAIHAFESVLEDDPANLPAIEALQAMYAKRRDWEKLVAVQRQLADLEQEPERRGAKYKEIAQQATKTIRRPDICLGLWEEVLAIVPGDLDALRALVGLYEREKVWERLVETIDVLVDRVDDSKEKVDLLQKAGMVRQDRQDDREGAVVVWQRLLEVDPNHRRGSESLKKVLIDLNDWDGLTAFFGEREKWGELVRVLEGQVGVQPDDAVKIDLLFRSAGIWEENLEQKDRAVRALERILQVDPNNLRGARALEPIYEAHKDYRKLAHVLEVLLEHCTEPARRRELMIRSAEIHESSLRNPDAAFDWIRRALGEHPADGHARGELVRLGGLTGQWATVHDELQEALYRVVDLPDPGAGDTLSLAGSDDLPKDQGDLAEAEAEAPAFDRDTVQLEILLTLGRILDEQMGAQHDALQRYQDALGLDEENAIALDALESLFTRMAQWHDLLGVLERKIALAEAPDDRKALYRKQGLIFEEQLDDPDSAVDRYQAIVEEDGSDLEALGALHRLFEAGERHSDLHDILRQELQLAAPKPIEVEPPTSIEEDEPGEGEGSGEDAGQTVQVELRYEPVSEAYLALKYQLGYIELRELGMVAESIDAFRDILSHDPSHEAARGALEALFEDLDHRGEVARILEPLYEEKGEWEALVYTLEVQLEASDQVELRFELLERIGELHTARTGDLDRAFHAHSRALHQKPESDAAIGELTTLADAGDKWIDLAGLLEEITPDVTDAELGQALLGRLAVIYEERLVDIDRAIDAHRRILEIDAESRGSIDALERLFLRSEQWHELLSIYRRKLELTEAASDQQALQFQIANLLEEMLSDANEAVIVYNEILDSDGENVRALRALDRLYGQLEMWPELGESLERLLGLCQEPEESIQLRVRLGGLQETRLGATEVAIETYRTVLEDEPTNEAALTALERLMSESDFQAAIADILEPIYHAQDEWRKLIGVYEIQREHAEAPERQVDLLHRIATLHANRGGDATEAFGSYARAFAVDASHTETLSHLHEIAEAIDLWGELVRVYEDQVLDIPDVATATDVHKRVARVLKEQLQDIERARYHYECAYQNDDADLQAIEALEEIYFQTEQWEPLVSIVLRKTELTEDIEAKKELYFRVSAIFEEMLQDHERAVETYRAVLEVDENEGRALDALERIFLQLRRFDELLEVLHKKAQLTEEVADRKAIFYVIGDTCDRELEDLPRAVDTYQAVLEWDPVDLTALQALDRLFWRLEQWEELLEILLSEAEVVEEDAGRLELHYRIAQLRESQLDAVPEAVEGFRSILERDPGHQQTLQSLEGLVRGDREAVAAVAVLEPVLQAAGAWERLIAVWRDLLEVTTDLEQRTALRQQIGQAYEEMLIDAEQAFTAYSEAFGEDPTHEPTLEALERVARSSAAWDRLVVLVEDQLATIHSDYVARDLYLRVARIFEEELASNVDAIERYRRVLEYDPDHEGAILALDRLYQKEGMWADLAEILRLEIERAEETEPRIELLIRLGTLYEAALEDVPSAIGAYREVLGEEPGQAQAVEALERLFQAGHEQPPIGEILEPLYQERESWEQLHGLLQALLAHQHPGVERMEAMVRLAKLSLDRLANPDWAFDWYGQAFQELPEEPENRVELASLAAKTERWADLITIYSEGLQKTQDVELLREVSHEMAAVHRERLHSDEAAEAMYQYILQLDPADSRALKGLDELFDDQHRWTELVDVLQREVSNTYDELELLVLMFRLGQVYETQLAELDLAVEQYRGVLEQEPHHEGALGRLEHIYLARDEWEPLFDVYGRQAEVAEADAEKARLYAQMAQLAHEALGRPEDAIDLWSQVLDLSGEDATALRALEGLYEEQERWRELVDVCGRQVGLVDNDVDREIALFAKLGLVWGEHLDRERNALENWLKVLDRDPDHEPALWALRQLHERTSEWEELARSINRLLERLPGEDPRRLDLYRQLGRLYGEELEWPQEAVQAWVSLLSIEAYDVEAIESLEDLYLAAEEWRSCVEILERKVAITEDVFERVSFLFRIAEMWEEHIGETVGAETAYAQVLELQADNIDAASQLERLYESGMKWEELVNLLLSRLEHATDPYERGDLYDRCAKVFEVRLQAPENAFLVLSRAFEEVRDDERFGAELERLAGETSQWTELITLYQGVIEALGTAPESVPLHLRVARWYDEKLNVVEHAYTHYQYALQIEPENLEALAAMESLLERYEKWPEVVTCLARRVELSVDPDERKEALQKMAGIQQERLDDVDAAIESYRQVLQIEETDLQTMRALEQLYVRRERWEDLIDVLTRETMVLYEPEEVVENHLRVGELWETRLGSADRAIEAYRQALVADDRCVDAMKALEKLYTAHDRWHELLDVYELMVAAKEAPEEQARIYGRMATILESELGDVPATIDAYRKMIGCEPENTGALRELERLYRDSQRWDELADAYRQHIEVEEVPTGRIALRQALAELYRGEIPDPYQAIDTLVPVLEIDGEHLATLTALGALYQETEDWERAIDALGREAQLLRDRADILDRHYRVGEIYLEKMEDSEEAELWFRAALDHDPNYLPALGALKGIYEARGDWNEVVRVLKMMEAASRKLEDKSDYLYEIGAIFAQRLGDRGTAIDYFEQAMDMHPQNAKAAEPLVEVYLDDERWERAEPLLDLLSATRQGGDLRELQKLHYQCGHVAEALHKDDKALTHYRKAYELDSTHLPTLRGMGALLYKREDWDRAFKIYQTILVHHREDQSDEEIVEIFYRQGAIKLKVGERRKALDFFRKSLDINPNAKDVLEAVIELYQRQSDWDEVVHYRRQLLGVTEDEVQCFANLVGIGDILREQLRNSVKAVEAYNEALQYQPDSKVVLSKLLDLYEGNRQWQEAVDILTRLAEMEADPSRQAKYYYAIAVIQRDELRDHFVAVRTFDKALEADPAMLKAFQAIDQILTKDRDYERQDRYYRKMLKRATESRLDEKLVFSLAKNLGEINRTRLKKYGEAIKAYKIALAKRADDPTVNNILAELYELTDAKDKAIYQFRKLIAMNPRNLEPYQNLFRMFYESARYDEAWCVCQVLSYLGHARPQEREFFEKYRSKTLTQARKALENTHWPLIYHPEESLLLAQVFSRVTQYTAPLMCVTPKDRGLHKKRHMIDLEGGTQFTNVLKYVHKITRLHMVEVWRAPENVSGLWNANFWPPAMLVGADVMSGRTLQDLAFINAKQLFMMRDHHYLASIETTYERRKQQLSTIIYTLTKLVKPNAEVKVDTGLYQAFQKRIHAADQAELTKLINKMSENPRQHLNLSKWLEMVEHSGNRLGLLMCNDLASAVRAVKNDPGVFSKAPVEDRVRELLLYALSDPYFKARKALGLAIG